MILTNTPVINGGQPFLFSLNDMFQHQSSDVEDYFSISVY